MLKITKLKSACFLALAYCLLLSSFKVSASELSLSNSTALPETVSYRSSPNTQPELCNSWMPSFVKSSSLATLPLCSTNINAGIGFLYFHQVRGGSALIFDQLRAKTQRVQTNFVYNRSPLIEASVAWNPSVWFGLGFTFLNQSNVFLQNYNVSKSVNTNPSLQIFSAKLQLNAFAAKFYFYLPYSLLWKTIAYTPYLNVSVGPSWQTWSRIQMSNRSGNSLQTFTQKVSANCFLGTDAGFKIKSFLPSMNLALNLGCKFNLWGQARSMGKASQQKFRGKGVPPGANAVSRGWALSEPWRVKTVYQWAPYVGLIWLF